MGYSWWGRKESDTTEYTVCLVKFIPKFFILFDNNVHGIVSLIFFWDTSLLVYRNTTDYCTHILYPATLLSLLVLTDFYASLVAQLVKNLPARQETRVQAQCWEDLLEKEMGTHSSILAWRIPWTEEPGGLHTVHGVARVRHDFTTKPPTTTNNKFLWTLKFSTYKVISYAKSNNFTTFLTWMHFFFLPKSCVKNFQHYVEMNWIEQVSLSSPQS